MFPRRRHPPSLPGVSSTIDTLPDGNRSFIQSEFQPNADYYRALATRQTPKVFWIGCSDSRISEHQMTEADPAPCSCTATWRTSSRSMTATSRRSSSTQGRVDVLVDGWNVAGDPSPAPVGPRSRT